MSLAWTWKIASPKVLITVGMSAAHPHQMREIEVRADDVATGRFGEAHNIDEVLYTSCPPAPSRTDAGP
jgi:hypothetical protein